MPACVAWCKGDGEAVHGIPGPYMIEADSYCWSSSIIRKGKFGGTSVCEEFYSDTSFSFLLSSWEFGFVSELIVSGCSWKYLGSKAGG